MIKTLNAKDIYRKCELKEKFSNTSELKELEGDLIGQERAKNALKYGLTIDKYGYNIFLSGEQSSRKKQYLKNVLSQYAKNKKIPDDLCYVNNFEDDTKPVLLKFPAGEGEVFKKEIEDFSKNIKEELIQTFSGNNYSKELEFLEQRYELEVYKLLQKYEEKILDLNFILNPTNEGYIPLPLDSKGRVMSQRKLNNYITSNQEKYIEEKNKVNVVVLEMLHEESALQDKKLEEIKEFDKNKVSELFDEKVEELSKKYSLLNPKIEKYLKGIKEYIIDNLNMFKPREDAQVPSELAIVQMMQEDDLIKLEEYDTKLSVNLIVNNKDLDCAPVIFAKDVDEYSLFGGMAFDTDKRTMVTKTDFSKIIPGDIVKANGGYLVIDVEEVIVNDMWNSLKKIMKNKEIKFTSKNISTVLLSDAIESEPIDIQLKIILIGSEEIHYLLYENDPDFKELFEVHSKFESKCDRNDDSELEYARLMAKYCNENNLNHLTYDAVCRVIEYSSRIAESQNKLVLHYSEMYRLLIEADALSKMSNNQFIDKLDIENALKNQRDRVDVVTEKLIENEKRNTFITTVTGAKVGEVNGLAVLDYGEFTVGEVSKITANTYKNKGYGIISVDKEANMSGPYHDKCVSIIQGFLGEEFAKESQISLAINISFEQMYGGVDGDSATLAETCAILSNLSKIPIKQNFGITGSMNQKGEAQIIGGVNDKIEGFYRTCKSKNAQIGAGVIIPKANIEDLMLNEEIVLAIEKGDFNIFAIDKIEDAVKLLMDTEYNLLKDEIISNL